MNRVFVLVINIGIMSCTGKQTDKSLLSSIIDSTQIVTTNDFYSISKTYGDVESDRLLLPTDIKQKIEPLRTRGREIEGQPYGGGDCWGKVRRFVLDNDTLTIDKYKCGEHGFGNKVFIKEGDSLKLAVTYRIDHSQNEKESWFNDVLETVEFKREEGLIKTSVETISDWNNIKLDRPPGKFDHFKGKNSSNDYLYFLEEYKKIKTQELVSD
jgi:hypothetical protein